jgi:hypothetical protein
MDEIVPSTQLDAEFAKRTLAPTASASILLTVNARVWELARVVIEVVDVMPS